jgi:CheY-like chemotaxis protein
MVKKKYTILVAEDEEYNFTLLKYIFEKDGALVIWAANGEEAVEIFRNNDSIDIVLMDIKMPVMNGIEATRAIKKIDKNMPVLAVTAYALVEDRERCLKAGCDDFMTKPIMRQKLLDLTNKWLNR